MQKKIIIDANFPSETRVVLLDKNNNIENIEFSSSNKKQIKGNIYLAKITRIEPSLQAAFVDYGEDYKVKFVDYGEDLKIKYVDYGEDKVGKWKAVDYGEKFKIKVVDYGEDFKVKEVDYGEGC